MKLKMLFVGLVASGAVACGGGDLVKEAEAKAKAACACPDADCAREHIKWFNEQSLKDKGAAVNALPPEKQDAYKACSLAAWLPKKLVVLPRAMMR